MKNSHYIYHSKTTRLGICGKYRYAGGAENLRLDYSKSTIVDLSYFSIHYVFTIIFKSGDSALVHIPMWIYFCFRKLIAEDDSFILLYPMSKPSRKLFPILCTRPNDTLRAINFLLFFHSPVLSPFNSEKHGMLKNH